MVRILLRGVHRTWSILVLAVLLTGCTQPEASTPDAFDGAPAPSDAPTEASDGISDGTSPLSWPALEDATIRPGVRVRECTSNFLFRTPDNSTLFLGVAAHCIHDLGDNATVEIADGATEGTVAYDSFAALDALGRGFTSNDPDYYNDFALVRLPDDVRPQVHPAVLHWGGPTGLARPAVQDHVIQYGNSWVREDLADANAADPTEGAITGTDDLGSTVQLVRQAVPGDSGSPVMRQDGAALGVLKTGGHVVPGRPAGTNGMSNLDHALKFANENAFHADLVTWDLLTEPLATIRAPE